MTDSAHHQSLLEPTSNAYPDCPGCKIAHLRAPGAPPPVKHLLFVATVVLCNSLPTCSLFPFLYFMVRDFHVAKRDEDIGFYAGWIGSIFMVGRCLTAMHWGQLADKYGRKPVMLAGVAAVAVFNVLFGASKSFWMALVSRFLLGSGNAILGPVKAYTSEICSEEHQALGVAVVGTTWGLGAIIGPAIGGYLSQPAVKYPTLFPQGSMFDRWVDPFPYLLPCLACSAVSMVGFVVTWHLPETIHMHKDNRAAKQNESEHRASIQGKMPDERHDAYKEGTGEEVVEAEGKTKLSATSLLGNWPLMATIIFYSIWSVQDMAFNEIFSLWCVSPLEYGGLGFTTTDVGNVLTGAGFSLLLFQMLFFPRIAKMLGPIKLTRLSAIATLPVLVAYPLLSNFSGAILKMSVLLVSILKTILAVGALSGSFLLINNSVETSQRGVANGLSISIVSFFKIIGPAAGGILFAWAQSRHSSFLPGSQIVFFLLGLNVLISALWTFPPLLPGSLDKPHHILVVY